MLQHSLQWGHYVSTLSFLSGLVSGGLQLSGCIYLNTDIMFVIIIIIIY